MDLRSEATNEHKANFLDDHGIEVVAHAGLGLRTAGIDDRIEGYGTLLSEH